MLIFIKFRSSLKLGHVGSKARSLGQILGNLVYTLEGSFDPKFMKLGYVRSSLKLGHVRSKTGSLGQIIEKLCVHSRSTFWIQSSLNYVRILIPIESRSGSKRDHVGSKTRSQGQILGKPCVHLRWHSFDPKFMKLC